MIPNSVHGNVLGRVMVQPMNDDIPRRSIKKLFVTHLEGNRHHRSPILYLDKKNKKLKNLIKNSPSFNCLHWNEKNMINISDVYPFIHKKKENYPVILFNPNLPRENALFFNEHKDSILSFDDSNQNYTLTADKFRGITIWKTINNCVNDMITISGITVEKRVIVCKWINSFERTVIANDLFEKKTQRRQPYLGNRMPNLQPMNTRSKTRSNVMNNPHFANTQQQQRPTTMNNKENPDVEKKINFLRGIPTSLLAFYVLTSGGELIFFVNDLFTRKWEKFQFNFKLRVCKADVQVINDNRLMITCMTSPESLKVHVFVITFYFHRNGFGPSNSTYFKMEEEKIFNKNRKKIQTLINGKIKLDINEYYLIKRKLRINSIKHNKHQAVSILKIIPLQQTPSILICSNGFSLIEKYEMARIKQPNAIPNVRTDFLLSRFVELNNIYSEDYKITCLEFSPDGEVMIIGYFNGYFELRSTRNLSKISSDFVLNQYQKFQDEYLNEYENEDDDDENSKENENPSKQKKIGTTSRESSKKKIIQKRKKKKKTSKNTLVEFEKNSIIGLSFSPNGTCFAVYDVNFNIHIYTMYSIFNPRLLKSIIYSSIENRYDLWDVFLMLKKYKEWGTRRWSLRKCMISEKSTLDYYHKFLIIGMLMLDEDNVPIFHSTHILQRMWTHYFSNFARIDQTIVRIYFWGQPFEMLENQFRKHQFPLSFEITLKLIPYFNWFIMLYFCMINQLQMLEVINNYSILKLNDLDFICSHNFFTLQMYEKMKIKYTKGNKFDRIGFGEEIRKKVIVEKIWLRLMFEGANTISLLHRGILNSYVIMKNIIMHEKRINERKQHLIKEYTAYKLKGNHHAEIIRRKIRDVDPVLNDKLEFKEMYNFAEELRGFDQTVKKWVDNLQKQIQPMTHNYDESDSNPDINASVLVKLKLEVEGLSRKGSFFKKRIKETEEKFKTEILRCVDIVSVPIGLLDVFSINSPNETFSTIPKNFQDPQGQVQGQKMQNRVKMIQSYYSPRKYYPVQRYRSSKAFDMITRKVLGRGEQGIKFCKTCDRVCAYSVTDGFVDFQLLWPHCCPVCCGVYIRV